MVAAMQTAVLIDEGFQREEVTLPVRRLRQEGLEVDVLARAPGPVLDSAGDLLQADAAVAQATTYGILIVPSGGRERMREHAAYARLVRTVADAGGVVGAIGHGPRLLIDAEVVAGRRVTSHPSMSRAVTNASGEWQDAEVVVDGRIVTCRGADDLGAFMDAVLAAAEPLRALQEGA